MMPRPPARRGACPAFLSPMETGDGLLLRLVPLDGGLSPTQLRGVATAAAAFGNGLVEVTARGSLQVRGLQPHTVAPLQDAILALGIAPRTGLAIDVSPLAGRDPGEIADARPLAAAIRAATAALEGRLGPKVSVVIDGGGAVSLDGQKADVRLGAVAAEGGPLWAVSIGGGAPQRMRAEAAATAAADALACIATLGRRARATDLPGCTAGPDDAADAPAPLGLIPLKQGEAAFGVGLPFGAADAGLLHALADAAQAAGAVDLRPAPGRALLATGRLSADAFAAAARQLGCLTGRDDPRAFIAACPGAPACACAHFPARALAPLVAAALAPLLDGTVRVHLSACAKGCAHPAPATLTLVGMDAGVALVHEGAPSQAAAPGLAPDGLVAALADLADGARAPGESGRDLLARRIPAARWGMAAAGDATGPRMRT
ncbi:precorrin-3B synthase [Xanthobacter sp. AM11]|uniref:precorrin-3B synthase n=1 Tax=Xanthobacter sp. AM11 TaxID=3380643 RepID=UPI0039BFE7CA